MSPPSLPVNFILILYFFVLLTPLATACFQDDYEVDETQVGRFFFLRADAPITEELSKLQPVVDGTDKILTHLARVENLIIETLKTGKAPGHSNDIRPCNGQGPFFGKKVTMALGIRGWPAPTFTCTTDVFGTDFIQSKRPEEPAPQYNVDSLFDALYKRGKAFEDNVKSIAKQATDNFTNPEVRWKHEHETPSQKCVLHPSVGFRIGDKWYLSHRIINKTDSLDPSVLGRQEISEYSRVVDGKLGDTKRMCLPVRPKTGVVHYNRSDATTLIRSTWARRVHAPSFIGQLRIEENPGILQSLDESDLFVQQAEGALTASNVAILVLPLVLNLIPIALLSDVSTITMLMYTLMSDILTVVPLGIKGAELTIIGRHRYRTIFVRIASGSNKTRLGATAAELYGAECRVHEKVLSAGIVFLVLSVVFLVGGVSAEFLARRYTMKQKERRIEEIEEASFSLLSGGSCTAGSAASQGTLTPTTLSSRDFQWRDTKKNPFDNGAFSESYNKSRADKME